MTLNMYNTTMALFFIMSLFAVDHVLGKGFLNKSLKYICKFFCLIKRALREDGDGDDEKAGGVGLINLPMLMVELLLLSMTVVILNKYKHPKGKDKIDQLLNESKETLRQTTEFLDKWRLRSVPSEYSYFDEDPRDLEQLKLEVPILHMAMVDTRAMNRSQLERGDAGETVNFTDSTLLSLSSLLDDDTDSITESTLEEQMHDEPKSYEINNRYLWDVMEEDSNVSE